MDDALRQTELYCGIWNEDPRYGTAIEDVEDTVYHRIVPHMVRVLSTKKPRVVDFGAGDGRFLARIWCSPKLDRPYLVGVDVYRPQTLCCGMQWVQKVLWEADVSGDYVISTDTLEHMPPSKVDAVLAKIAQCAPHGFLRISTKQDIYGTERGLHLHETVQGPDWWLERIRAAGITPSSWRIYPGSAVEVWF